MTDDFNPLGNFVAPNALEAIVFQLRKMVTNLTVHADHDGRAQDAVNYINFTIDALVSEPYTTDTSRTVPAEDAAADIFAPTENPVPKSPGKDPVTGEDLAPFTPSRFPSKKGDFERGFVSESDGSDQQY